MVIHVKFFVDMKNFIKNKLLLSSTLNVIIDKLITSYVVWDEFGEKKMGPVRVIPFVR